MKKKCCGKQCIHSNGSVYLSLPPQWDEWCCNCGHKERVQGEALDFIDQQEHGPHLNAQI